MTRVVVIGAGVSGLVAAIRALLTRDAGPPEPDAPAPSEREAAALTAARAELAALLADCRANLPYDILGVRLETASALVADVTGETTPDAVLNAVFDRFCIGK